MQVLPIRLGRPLDISPATILVYVGEGLIGDAFMRLPFAAGLRAAFPNARISWAFRDKASSAGRRIAPLLKQFSHELLLDLALGDGPHELLRSRPLDSRRWDLVVDTQRVVPRALLVSRIRHRRFASFAGRYCLSDVKPVYRWGESVKVRHYGRQLMSLLSVIETGSLADPRPFRPVAVAIPGDVAAWGEARIGAGPRAILIAPGAGGQTKRWPLEAIQALARNLVRAGHRVGFILGPAERDWMAALAQAVPEAGFPLADLPGSIAAQEPFATMALASLAGITVAMDSGVGHMLAAASPRHVALFGPTKPETFAPAAHQLTVVAARDYGGQAMADIPEEAVRRAVLDAAGGAAVRAA